MAGRIALEGRDSPFGIRPLRRAVGKLPELPLGKEIIAGRIERGYSVRIDIDPEGYSVFNFDEPLERTILTSSSEKPLYP